MSETGSISVWSDIRQALIELSVIVLLFIGAVAIGLAAIWWKYGNRDEVYYLYDTTGQSPAAQIAFLDSFNDRTPCEYRGKLIQRDERIALKFTINTVDDDGPSCIRDSAPPRIKMVRLAN